MQMILKYLRPQQQTIFLALLFAAKAEVLVNDRPYHLRAELSIYIASDPPSKQESELIKAVAGWLAIAIAVALSARLAKAAQD
jgi:ATP-binding cassette subfamily B protein